MNKLLVRAKLAGRILRYVPFVRLVALNGSIVRGEENAQSDIDILIIAKAGRLYTARFFATCLIALTGYRRHGSKIAGRICLNCYLNDKNPSIMPEGRRDMAKVAKAYKYMIPLVDDGISHNFIKTNKWFDSCLVRGKRHSDLLRQTIFKKFPFKPKNKFLNKILSARSGDFLERKLMTYQVGRILSGKQQHDQIYANEFTIKLHPKKH